MLERMRDVDEMTLGDWLDRQGTASDLAEILHHFADTADEIAARLRHAHLHGEQQAAGQINVQGEEQKQLDIIAHDIAVERFSTLPQVAALVSEEVPDLIVPERAGPAAPFILCFDPLDGSSNLEVNGAVGSILSVLERTSPNGACDEAEVLAATTRQRAAAYVLYGPATLMVLTLGEGAASFTLDGATGTFHLVEMEVHIPESASEFSINMAHQRFFTRPVAAYISECLAGDTGPRGKPFNMRWAAAMVADVHRLFVRGGIFIYPALDKPGGASGKLRFLYEANPMALLVEAAGGKAISGDRPLRDHLPQSLHERVPVALGSREEVERLAGHYT